MFKKGVREGYGRLVHHNGDIYTGNWSKDRANGQGTFRNTVGYSYEGQWLNDAQHGYGMEIWQENNSRYTGIFRHGKKWGRGCYEWPDGSYYDGDLVDGCFEG